MAKAGHFNISENNILSWEYDEIVWWLEEIKEVHKAATSHQPGKTPPVKTKSARSSRVGRRR